MSLKRSDLNTLITVGIIGLLLLSAWFLRWRYVGTQWRVNRFTGAVQQHVFPEGPDSGKWIPAETPDIEFVSK
jgi:hypothetical protein